MLAHARKPVVGFAAYSGTGKTTLLKAMIPLFRRRGIRVGMIKQTHHAFEIDSPGKDSYELRKAGASQMLIASAQREALIVEKEAGVEPDLNRLLDKLDQQALEIILVEGFKNAVFPKVELYRAALGTSPLYPDDQNIIAVATDGDLPVPADLPVLDINNPAQIVDFLCDRYA